MKIKFQFLLFFCLAVQQLNAKHIISGTMAYTCLGDNEYEIEMILYRDCGGGGAPFDMPASFAIYTEDELANIIEVAPVSVDSVIAAPFEDCPEHFEGYCVQKGRYRFNVSLIYKPMGYTISYQRCCWSGSIVNILDPLDTGITITTEITALGQTLCNTQPLYEDQMAFASCPGTEIEMPIPQSDEEGDSLVFELCMPFEGAGPLGIPEQPGDPFACTGITPTPACPPPYEEVLYAAGYDDSNPFPTVDGITFNPDNNSLMFVPTTVGRYIFSLCMTEYRDGEVISSYRTNYHVQGDASISTDNPFLENDIELLNQASDILVSSSTTFEDTSVQLFDYTGRVIRTQQFDHTNVMTMSKRNIPSGIYFLSIAGANHKRVVKKVYID